MAAQVKVRERGPGLLRTMSYLGSVCEDSATEGKCGTKQVNLIFTYVCVYVCMYVHRMYFFISGIKAHIADIIRTSSERLVFYIF